MIQNILRVILLCVCACFATQTNAEVSVGNISFTPFSVKGLTVSKTIKLDSAFGKKFGRSIASPIKINVPVSKKFLNYYDPSGENPNDTTLLKITFATHDKQVIENIRLVPAQIGMREPGVRIRAGARLLSEKAFPAAARGYLKSRLLGIVQTRINGADAVVGVGQFTDPSIGLLYARLVLILNPADRHSILAFATINPKLSAANRPDLLHKAGITYKVVESIEFLKQDGKISK
jgi:hypothetical protein